MPSLIAPTDPMGIYDTLYRFKRATGLFMGEPGTHPWSQGFPLTTRLPDGPELPSSVSFDARDLLYPKPWGAQPLREAIAAYYRDVYGARITAENVMVYPGGRPALLATLLLLRPDVRVLIEETEYTPYWDVLSFLGRPFDVVPSNEDNAFRPTLSDYEDLLGDAPSLLLMSNPCNPTGVVKRGDELADFVRLASRPGVGGLFDEAYEFFVEPEPVSALAHVENIDDTDVFVAGAVTKGLQAPGLRVGWIVAARDNVERLSNYATFGMGGVSALAQIAAAQLLEPARARQARAAVSSFYATQRARYGELMQSVGVRLYTGPGGFYHWGALPGDLSADVLNERLFAERAAILPGRLCDMKRRGESGPHKSLFRFSFGPLLPDSFVEDERIWRAVLP